MAMLSAVTCTSSLTLCCTMQPLKGSPKQAKLQTLTNPQSLQVSSHKDALHYDNVEHRDMHNLSGALFHIATAHGLTLSQHLLKPPTTPPCLQVSMHKDALHYGDVEHRDMHNLNGALFHNATAHGLTLRGRTSFGSDGDRPFVLSRSFFAGSQRIGPIWTGDNAATWEQLRVSVPMLLSINIAGLPFAGKWQIVPS